MGPPWWPSWSWRPTAGWAEPLGALERHVGGPLPPRLALGQWPVPWTQLPGPESGALFVKREDQSGRRYGGNKVRKLEFILARARSLGQDQLLTGGAAGSHHVAATALYAADLGIAVHAVLVPQPDSAHAREMLRLSAARCASLIPVARPADLPGALLALGRRLGAGCASVPIGGSSPQGLLGSIDLGLEIAEDIQQGLIPMPVRLLLPLGSGGSAVGVWLGLRLAGQRFPVWAIQVSPGPFARRGRLRGLARQALALLPQTSHLEPDLEGLVVDRRWSGAGYGSLDAPTLAALDFGGSVGLAGIEQTYSARALAAALHHRQDGPQIFIHTASSRPIAPLLTGEAPRLPPALAALLGGPP